MCRVEFRWCPLLPRSNVEALTMPNNSHLVWVRFFQNVTYCHLAVSWIAVFYCLSCGRLDFHPWVLTVCHGICRLCRLCRCWLLWVQRWSCHRFPIQRQKRWAKSAELKFLWLTMWKPSEYMHLCTLCVLYVSLCAFESYTCWISETSSGPHLTSLKG